MVEGSIIGSDSHEMIADICLVAAADKKPANEAYCLEVPRTMDGAQEPDPQHDSGSKTGQTEN